MSKARLPAADGSVMRTRRERPRRGGRLLVVTALGLATLSAATPAAETTTAALDQPAALTGTGVSTPAAQRALVRGVKPYNAPGSAAALALAKTPAAQVTTRKLLAKISGQPEAVWFGDWLTAAKARTHAATLVSGAKKKNALLPVVLYDIPFRDCSGYSRGGATSDAAYRTWINAVAAGLGGGRVVAILEPDALPKLDCLTAARQTARLALLRYAVARLASTPGVAVYLDAGHSDFKSVEVISARLRQAGVAQAAGFTLNVANFQTTAAEVAYGRQVSAAVGGAHFLVDTSRNGAGPATGSLAWCNPPNRALGPRPTTSTGDPLLDARLWVKTVGLSDGACRTGAPKAGVWWLSYALGLATRATW
jgi:endoglucanase